MEAGVARASGSYGRFTTAGGAVEVRGDAVVAAGRRYPVVDGGS
jgi:hypothetical protein